MTAATRPQPVHGWDALRVALAAALLTYVWRIQDLFAVLGAIKLLAFATLVVAVLFMLDPRAQAQMGVVVRHPLARLTLLLACVGALSVPGSLWPGLSAEFLLKNLVPTVGLALVVASGIHAVSDARRFAAVQVVGAALYAAVILVRFDIGPEGRLGNLVNYDANDLGMLLVCTLPLAVFFIRHARTLVMRACACGIVGLYLLTIIKTGSRGAFLGLVAVVLFLLVRFRSVPVRSRLLMFAAVVALIVAGGSGQYWNAMSTMMTPTEDYNWIGNQEGGRMNVWRRGIGYMAQRPVTGVGLAAFPIAEGTISTLATRQSYGRGLKWSAAHNSFVQAGAELGIAGFLIFVAILGLTGITASRLARDARATRGADTMIAPLADVYAAAIVGYAVSGFFLSQAYGPYLYVVVGTVIGLDIAARRP